MLPLELEDWLTEEGDKVVRRVVAASSRDALTGHDRLLYEFWLFDTEQRNGGVSQYFFNNGLEQWDTLSRLAASEMPSFQRFAAKVNEVVGRSGDPYRAVIESDVDLDAWYARCQIELVTELRAAVVTRE